MHHAFHSRFRSHAAESLIETLVAITVIVIATAAALSVMRTAISGNDLIEGKVVAVNLALEGVEALRNIRDTNYLMFASDPDNCWNKYSVVDVSDCSDGTAPAIEDFSISGKTYSLTRNFASDPTLAWNLQVLTGANDAYLDLYNVNLEGDSTPESQLYAQSGVDLINPDFTIEAHHAFARTISFTYNGATSYDATVTVTWNDMHGAPHSMSLTRTISNIY